MKKIFFSTLALATSLTMLGEGYQVNTLSVKQEGMGHTGVALKLGAESMIFNPAGMAFMDKTLDLSASVSGIFSEASAVHEGTKYETSSDVSTPFQISGAFSIYDNLKAGVTINTPYGSGIDWTDNWPGAVLNQSVKIQVFNIQPTVSYKILPNLSVGAGLMIAWGKVDLDKGLVNPNTFNGVLAQNGLPTEMLFSSNASPVSVNLKGTAEVALGFNVGAMWDINDKFTVGASYRSKMDMKVKAGDAKLTYANQVAEQHLSSLTNLNNANFKAQLPAVSVLSFGVSYKPIERLTLAFDAQLSGWSDYEQLDIEFAGLSAFDQHLKKDYSDSWAFRLGGQFAMTERLDLRAGFIVDTTPVNDEYFNPETPGMTRLEPCVGLSFRPTKNLSVDLAFTYIAGVAREGSNAYTDLVAAQAYQTALGSYGQDAANQVAAALGGIEKNFSAKYDITAFVPAIGLSYSF